MKRRHFLAGMGATGVIPVSGCNIFSDKDDDKNESAPFFIDRRMLGETGIEISRLGFGSHLKAEVIAAPENRDRMIKRGFEGGINLFDVYNHSGYNQFKPMGESLRDIRTDVVISLCAVNITSALQAEIDGALTDFHTDYIDLYRLYSVNDERMDIMVKAKEAGKVRAIGIVGHDVGTINGYLDRYGSTIDYIMMILNFHHNKAIILGNHTKRSFTNDYSSLLPRILELKLGIIGMKPMGSDAMIDLAREHSFFERQDINIAQAMLRYVFQTSEIDTVLTAMNSMEEVDTNLDAAYAPALSSEEMKALEELSEIASSTESAYLPARYRWLENWSTRQA